MADVKTPGDLFTKNLHAENVYADHGYFSTLTASSTLTSELGVDDICITRDQFKALVEGSVLGSHVDQYEEQEAADTSSAGASEAPATTPAPVASDTDAPIPSTPAPAEDGHGA